VLGVEHPPELVDLLRLTLISGLGPVRIARLLAHFRSCEAIFRASPSHLEQVKGIGRQLASAIVEGRKDSDRAVEAELALAEQLGVSLVSRISEDYPSLLNQFEDAPPLLYVRGSIETGSRDRYPVAIVGSRHCTTYGLEQAERFASVLAQAGLSIVSGGARGIDTAAHRGAVKAGGRTVAVLGCGLGHCYPPENKELFDRIVAGSGAIVSELPLNTPPSAENFPARNRIISALSLGVVVIEAGVGSGALITARQATEEHGREVMALPGRVDSEASRGSNELLKSGGAALITEPGDVLSLLESPARHSFQGTHEARFAPPETATSLFEPRPNDGASPGSKAESRMASLGGVSKAPKGDEVTESLTDAERIVAALAEPCSVDELSRATGLDAAALRARLTMLEIERRVVREGSRFRVK
jgi:DNA processing protein